MAPERRHCGQHPRVTEAGEGCRGGVIWITPQVKDRPLGQVAVDVVAEQGRTERERQQPGRGYQRQAARVVALGVPPEPKPGDA